MAIKVGDQIPSVILSYINDDGPQTISTEEIFKGKKVVSNVKKVLEKL